ncbi:MAG TPA: hypothetical protein DIW31_11160 [Bacteroidales bacterium]|nr:hypothetical protein [Bacteroidales bacterium]
MKKQLLFTLTIIVAITVRLSAQIPNGGFENWETVSGYFGSCENPTGWVSSNIYSAGSFYAITKSTDHYPDSIGSYSIKIENNTTLSNSTNPVQSYSGRGFVSTGMPPPIPNFAISGHPTSVTGYYKYAPLNGDVILIYITLFKNGTAVSTGELESGNAVPNWAPFTITLSQYTTADSASILLAAYRSADLTILPLGNSVLYVDNIDFGAFITPSTNAVSLDTSAHIAVISNTTWTAVSDQSWLLVSPDTATKGNDTISFTATANSTITARTATVTVSATGVTSQTITVTQAAGTGFVTVGEDDFVIYPNPATSIFSINTQSLTTVQIYTLSGTLVLSKLVNSEECIPTNNLTKGMYVVKIITDNAVMTKTLIVE